MKILFMTEIGPFPPNSGEKLRSYNLIKSMLLFAEKMYVISGNRPTDGANYSNAEFYDFPDITPKNRRWRNMSMLFKLDKRIVTTIEDILKKDNIDIAFLDYNFIGNYIKFFKKRNIKVIYGTHNIQSDLNYQTPALYVKDGIFKNVRYFFEKAHEYHYFRKADAILTVSDEDSSYYRVHFPKKDLYMIPNFVDEKEYLIENESTKKKQIIMSGNYYAFQNKFGMKWFIENVWDEELASLANFIIVGHGSDEMFDQIQRSGVFTRNITALGKVDDMKKYIIESKAAIIPLLHGSGTRLKCIEAMALKTNIVATTIGVEGIKHDGAILTADNPFDFKQNLIKVLKNQVDNAENAFSIFMDNYSSSAIKPQLKKIFQKYLSAKK
jgi:polysaccharide biosynthesis protein PslH